MKNFIQVATFLILGLLSTNMLCAQNEDNKPQEPSFEQIAQSGNIQIREAQPATAASFQFSPLSNEVFIQQIGANNASALSIASSNSRVNLTQTGNSNSTTLELNAQNINYSISQDGNLNSYLHSNAFSSDFIGITTNQNGVNNSIEKYGSNAVSDKMIITQSGDDMSLLIRSF